MKTPSGYPTLTPTGAALRPADLCRARSPPRTATRFAKHDQELSPCLPSGRSRLLALEHSMGPIEKVVTQ